MSTLPPPVEHQPGSDTSDHVQEARLRARQVLGGEAHLGGVDDWRRALVSARDAVILLLLCWLAIHGFGDLPFSGLILLALTFGLALLVGISTARSTHAQVQYYATELDRERQEIRHNFEHERDEVRALYAAKGFQPPVLDHIVDTLSADDDRLLKVMMEEELGLAMHHMNHPLLVGAWNFGGALIAGLALIWPTLWLSPDALHLWMPLGGGVLLAMISTLGARSAGHGVAEWIADGLVTAAVSGGAVYFLSQCFAAWVGRG